MILPLIRCMCVCAHENVFDFVQRWRLHCKLLHNNYAITLHRCWGNDEKEKQKLVSILLYVFNSPRWQKVPVLICCYLPFSSLKCVCVRGRERLQQVNWSICMSFWNAHRSHTHSYTKRDSDTSKLSLNTHAELIQQLTEWIRARRAQTYRQSQSHVQAIKMQMKWIYLYCNNRMTLPLMEVRIELNTAYSMTHCFVLNEFLWFFSHYDSFQQLNAALMENLQA